MLDQFQVLLLSALFALVIGGGIVMSLLFVLDKQSGHKENQDPVLPHENDVNMREAELMDEKDAA